MLNTTFTGLESYEVDLEKQSVVVIPATATYDEVYEKIKKTGKEVICFTSIYPTTTKTTLIDSKWQGG